MIEQYKAKSLEDMKKHEPGSSAQYFISGRVVACEELMQLLDVMNEFSVNEKNEILNTDSTGLQKQA